MHDSDVLPCTVYAVKGFTRQYTVCVGLGGGRSQACSTLRPCPLVHAAVCDMGGERADGWGAGCAVQSGGAIYADSSNVTVEGSWFVGNTAYVSASRPLPSS